MTKRRCFMSLNSLMAELDERMLAQRIGIPHDAERMRYSLRSNTIGSFEEFESTIADYYTIHFTACISHGGILSRFEATSRAKALVEREFRRRGGTIMTAYNDSHDGTNGGMRAVLDTIAEALKAESLEMYIRDVFDRHVKPDSIEQQVEIISQFIAQCGVHLGSSIRNNDPKYYARDYRELIQAYKTALEKTSSIFRRI
jgi:hypothetical protein